MYDSVFFRLTSEEAGGVDFFEETACYLSDVCEHSGRGDVVITGSFGGLKVSLSRYQVKVKDGSLCKFYLGDNQQTLRRADVEGAIQKLSDGLHLPMGRAAITRLDLAQNFVLKNPVETYLSHLGRLKYAERLQEPSGLYYNQSGGRLCFYDKNREQKQKRAGIDSLYDGRHVLRYEQRYTTRIASQLGKPSVKGGDLFEESFYIDILNRWRDSYQAIQKVNDISLNFEAMKTKQDLYKMGVLSLAIQAGGEIEMIDQINEAQKRGELTNKQAFDLREAVKSACKLKDGLTVKNDAIEELNKKVDEAVRFYR